MNVVLKEVFLEKLSMISSPIFKQYISSTEISFCQNWKQGLKIGMFCMLCSVKTNNLAYSFSFKASNNVTFLTQTWLNIIIWPDVNRNKIIILTGIINYHDGKENSVELPYFISFLSLCVCFVCLFFCLIWFSNQKVWLP